MEKRIAGVRYHYIICCTGMMGLSVVRELFTTKAPVIAVDLNENKLEFLRTRLYKLSSGAMSFIILVTRQEKELLQALVFTRAEKTAQHLVILCREQPVFLDLYQGEA